tara:strand:+ start:371 stop:1009 length:639 start_codon:yes stop_codon:yes gene_type:complete
MAENDGKSERPALQQRSRESRKLLIKAGFKAFSRYGYEGARVADIAAEVGLSVGSFYHRFGDKRGFFDVLMDEFVKRGMDGWDLFFAESSVTKQPDQLFKDLVAGMSHTVVKNIGFFHAYLSLGREDANISKSVGILDKYAGDRLFDWLEERGITEDRGITREMTHFGINTVGKTLAFSAVIEGTYFRPDNPQTIAELTEMLRRYLNMETCR